ncbi:MAG: hypothetical protein NVS1B2_19390 [Vulcanimicrobiaceae bacterium]
MTAGAIGTATPVSAGGPGAALAPGAAWTAGVATGATAARAPGPWAPEIAEPAVATPVAGRADIAPPPPEHPVLAIATSSAP